MGTETGVGAIIGLVMVRVLAALLAVAAAMCLVAGPGVQAAFSGKARVVDAGEIIVGGTHIRLHGLMAPDWGLTCAVRGRPWRCGMEAASALAFFIGSNWVDCVEHGRDATGVVTAVCYAGGAEGGPEINAWLVLRGWALAEPGRGARYRALQDKARSAGRGLWRGDFPPPSEWGAQQNAPPAP